VGSSIIFIFISQLTLALESTKPPTEMSNTIIPGSKGRQVRKADKLTAICELTV
jgi:hypothetical protein